MLNFKGITFKIARELILVLSERLVAWKVHKRSNNTNYRTMIVTENVPSSKHICASV